MLTFGEMIYVCALMALCFIVTAIRTVYNARFPNSEDFYYILLIFLLFLGSMLLFIFIRRKCVEYERDPQKEAFLTLKKVKNASELVYIADLIFIIPTFFDVFNPSYTKKISENFIRLFTGSPFWELLLGLTVIVFGFKTYLRFYKTNKVYSELECENYKSVPKSVYQEMKQYPTFEEYEKGIACGGARKVGNRKSENDEQERFLREHEVPIEDIEQRLAGLEVSRIVNGNRVYSKSDFAGTDPGDNSLSACPLCGSLNKSGSDECSFCGTNLKNMQ